MITTAKIIKYDGKFLLLAPDADLFRELTKKIIGTVEIRLTDGRTISPEQRKKIFALVRDIAIWNGDNPETIRQLLTLDFVMKNGLEDLFSLSDVDMTTAREFITYLIDFCFKWDVPTKDTLLNCTDDIGKYLYSCLEHRKCAICNKRAEIHHVDHIGMGRDREQIVHVGLNAVALCREHHDMAHRDEKGLFKHYFIYGIRLDEYLCKCLSLRSKKKMR